MPRFCHGFGIARYLTFTAFPIIIKETRFPARLGDCRAVERDKGEESMNISTQQLQYLVEIERTRSISQAAANLYMGQPNLSRVLRDTETALGFAIFERTRKGVRPTEKGAQFLQHARNILRETDFMERLGPNSTQPNRFRICIPRSYGYMELVQQYLVRQDWEQGLDAMIRECHPRHALELLENGSAEIAVIRYCVEYQDYFSEQAAAKELTVHLLNQTEYQIVVSAGNPLAQRKRIGREELEHGTDLIHRDTFYPSNQVDTNHYQVYVVDRAAQLQLLAAMPNAFLWSEPLPASMLEANRLAQRPCAQGGIRYQNALVYKPQCAMSEMERGFLRWMEPRQSDPLPTKRQ